MTILSQRNVLKTNPTPIITKRLRLLIVDEAYLYKSGRNNNIVADLWIHRAIKTNR